MRDRISRLRSQGLVDWLFEAILRHQRPEIVLRSLSEERSPGHLTIQLQPKRTVRRALDSWLSEQIRYHEMSRDTMKAMNVALGRCGRSPPRTHGFEPSPSGGMVG